MLERLTQVLLIALFVWLARMGYQATQRWKIDQQEAAELAKFNAERQAEIARQGAAQSASVAEYNQAKAREQALELARIKASQPVIIVPKYKVDQRQKAADDRAAMQRTYRN